MEVLTKKCSKCGEVKGVEEFWRRNDQIGKYRSHCKTCTASKLHMNTALYRENELFAFGFKKCSKCKMIKPTDQFWMNNHYARFGLESACITCRKIRIATYRLSKGKKVGRLYARAYNGDKICLKCLEFKPLSEFPLNRSLSSGTKTYCKKCDNQRARDYRANLGNGYISNLINGAREYRVFGRNKYDKEFIELKKMSIVLKREVRMQTSNALIACNKLKQTKEV